MRFFQPPYTEPAAVFMKFPIRDIVTRYWKMRNQKLIFIMHSYIYSRGLPKAVLVFDYRFTILCHSAWNIKT